MLTTVEAEALALCADNLDKLGSGNDRSYLAAVALSEFFGGPPNGYSLRKAKADGFDRFWVVNKYGDVLDPARELFNGAKPPYRYGHKAAKRNTITKHAPLLEVLKSEIILNDRAPTIDIVGRRLVVEKTAVLTDQQQDALWDAWHRLAADWASNPEEFLRCHFPKGMLAVYFVRALIYGEEIPRTATISYVPDRYYVAGSHSPFSDVLPKAAKDRGALRGLRFILGDEVSYSKLVSTTLPVQGHRIPNDFPIGLARELVDKHCPVGGSVLDPCHGWGGRLVGFMLSRASRYVGIDPAPHSYKLKEMFDDLSVYLPEPKRAKLINKPFEDVRLSDSSYDFALTSPPYFNTEKYNGEDSSWRRYKTLDAWMEGFYRPLIGGVAAALKPGAHFALQVTTKYKMVEAAKEMGASVDLEFLRVSDTAMRRYNAASADRAGSTDPFEVTIIFRKAR